MSRAGRRLRAAIAALSLAAAGAAQQEPPPPTAAEIEAALVQVGAATDLDDAQRARAVGAYQDAQRLLQEAQDWRAKAAEFEDQQRAAPARLEAIRARLDAPLGGPVADLATRSPDAIDQLLAQARADSEAASREVDGIEAETAARAQRRVALPQLISDVRSRLAASADDADLVADPKDPPAVGAARRVRALARRVALQRQLDALEREVASYEARGDLLPARRDLAIRRRTEADRLVAAYQAAATERRQQEAERARGEAAAALQDSEPALAGLAGDNAALAEERTRVARSVTDATAELASARADLDRLDEAYRDVEKRIGIAGLTEAIGLQLRRHGAWLDSLERQRRRGADRHRDITTVQLRWLEIDDERASLVDLDGAMRTFLDDLAGRGELPATGVDRLRQRAGELLSARRDGLVELGQDLAASSTCWSTSTP